MLRERASATSNGIDWEIVIWKLTALPGELPTWEVRGTYDNNRRTAFVTTRRTFNEACEVRDFWMPRFDKAYATGTAPR